MIRILTMAALAACIAASAACQREQAAAAGAQTQPAATDQAAPAPAPDTPREAEAIGGEAVATFLAARYGQDASLTGDWTSAPVEPALREPGDDGGNVTRSVCAREHVSIDGRPAVLMAVCGTPDDAGHPTPGITDFWLLRQQAGVLGAAAQAHLARYGSLGNAGDIDVERFGAHLYGFTVESSFYNMGEGIDTRTLLLPRGAAFVEAGWMRAGMDSGEKMDDCSARGDCPADGYAIDFDLDIDDSDPQAPAYPLVVRESGIACRKPARGEYRLRLDTATMTYAVPKALQRDTGCTAP